MMAAFLMPKTRKEQPIMATDYTEKITSIEEQIAQLKNRQRELMQKHKVKERKERTRRLIERGAIAESLIDGADELTNEQFKSVIERALQADQSRQTAAEAKPQGDHTTDADGDNGAVEAE
jgi:TolA-binding protein